MVTNTETRAAAARNNCPVSATLALIEGKWKVLILYHLTFGKRRFGELAVRLSQVSRKVLTEKLKELERDGLIVRKQYNEIPPRVEYSLSETGESLSLVFAAMAQWGTVNVLAKRTDIAEREELVVTL